MLVPYGPGFDRVSIESLKILMLFIEIDRVLKDDYIY